MKRDLARRFYPSQACLYRPLASCVSCDFYLGSKALAGRVANLGTDVHRDRREVPAVRYPPQPQLPVVIGHDEGEGPGVDTPGHAQSNRSAIDHSIQ